MNRNLRAHQQSQLNTQENAHNIVVFDLLRLIQADTKLTLDFSKAFEVSEFQLGDEIVTYTLPNSLVDNKQNSCGF